MRHALKAVLVALVLLVGSAAPMAAGPFEEVAKAYNRGDYATALRLARPLAEQGDAHAQYNLGVMYRDGRVVPQDDAEAVKWLRDAAEQGYAAAQHNLGFMYERGLGVPQDYVKAHKWFDLAASSFSASDKVRNGAVKKREHATALMTPAQIAEAQKLAREWEPK